jgi:hypothetical protein
MLSRGLEYPCTESEYLCIGLECLLQCWKTYVQSWNAFYKVGMLSTGMECFREDWNAFDRVGIPLYTVEMLSRGLECFRQRCNTFVQSWIAF